MCMTNKSALRSSEAYHYLLNVRFKNDENLSHHDIPRKAVPNSQESLPQLHDSIPKKFRY